MVTYCRQRDPHHSRPGNLGRRRNAIYWVCICRYCTWTPYPCIPGCLKCSYGNEERRLRPKGQSRTRAATGCTCTGKRPRAGTDFCRRAAWSREEQTPRCLSFETCVQNRTARSRTTHCTYDSYGALEEASAALSIKDQSIFTRNYYNITRRMIFERDSRRTTSVPGLSLASLMKSHWRMSSDKYANCSM